MLNAETSDEFEDVAVIGMSGRFPEADNIDALWQNLCEGQESVTFFSDEELHPSHFRFNNLNSNYVKARAVLNDVEFFDASFFKYLPREAQIMDPQNRFLLEVSWNALENAGYAPELFEGKIGVFAGKGYNSYFANNVSSNKNIIETYGEFESRLLNEKDFLATQVSYKLNLNGPSLNINTGCSTSLVAICQAYDSLLSYQCDIALAGGVSIYSPQNTGYIYQEGKIASQDGHARPFDQQATGTVFGNGSGIVVLKRLSDALEDNDYIYSVIKGCGLNNDGSDKLSFTAPSINGQIDAILLAQANADVPPESISFVEAHGTGTNLGDPIEIEALTQAFRTGTEKKQFCAVGSVKSNIGHLDSAAGVAGFIKTVLALHHKKLPPTINYYKPNNNINFNDSPFFVCNELTDLKSEGAPLRAGVSAFGVGGTNAHVIVEEAPELSISESLSPWYLIPLSAKTDTALNNRTKQLSEHLKMNAGLNIGDVAYTLQKGRQDMDIRRTMVCRDVEDLVNVIEKQKAGRIITRADNVLNPPIVFMFSGQGSQHINMGYELFKFEPVFKYNMEKCSIFLKSLIGIDLCEIVYPDKHNEKLSTEKLNQTSITQPALFIIEYSLAKLWMEWGVKPDAMIGHSIGEFVAACLAGVFSLEDALYIVANRAKLMQQMPEGKMCAVRLPFNEVEKHLHDSLSIALYNGPELCVVAGVEEDIDSFINKLKKLDVVTLKLHTSHAFHSEMMEPVLKPFIELFKKITLNSPQIPFISNLTGTWITNKDATDPEYWAKHLRSPVLFNEGIKKILNTPDQVLIEVGPGTALSTLARQHKKNDIKYSVVATLSHVKEPTPAFESMLTALGKVWLAGKQINWNKLYKNKNYRRIPLPTYPFDRKRYWLDSITESEAKTEVIESKGPNEFKNTVGTKSDNIETGSKRFASKLKILLGDISGISLLNVSEYTKFTEMGFDSLFLIQFALNIKKEFALDVKFSMLLKEYPNIYDLSKFIENNCSAEVGLKKFSIENNKTKNVEINNYNSRFFGKDSKKLFGAVYQPAENNYKRTGILLCYPLASEYMRTHWAYKTLANSLTGEGYPVFKFDYFCTGDSAGDSIDGNVKRWVDSILEAVAEFKNETQINQISIVGLRFGASLAVKAVETGLIKAKDLILIDPVISGVDYLNDLRKMHNAFVDDQQQILLFPHNKKIVNRHNEMLGFLFPEKMQSSINQINLLSSKYENIEKISIIGTAEKVEYSELFNKIKEENVNSKEYITHENCFWDDWQMFDIALVANNTFQKVIDIIVEG